MDEIVRLKEEVERLTKQHKADNRLIEQALTVDDRRKVRQLWDKYDAEIVRTANERDAEKARADTLAEQNSRLLALADLLKAQRNAADAEVERLRPLAAFGTKLLTEFYNDGEPGDLDGGWMQDTAIEAGLLVHPDVAHDPGDCECCADESRSCYVIAASALAAHGEGK